MEAARKITCSKAVVLTHLELSSAEYHAENEHTSSSQLVPILRTPAHYKHHEVEAAVEETDLMRLGTAAHTMLLETNEFQNRYVFSPRSYDLRKNIDKAELALIEKLHPGKTVLEPKEVAMIEKLAKGMRNHARARLLLSAPGQPELSIFWRDSLTGLLLKVRIDKYVELGATGVMLEVKTTDDASKSGFARKITAMDYDMRAAMYIDGIQHAFGFTPEVEWLVIERETGFVATYNPSPRMLQRGRNRYEKARLALAHARRTNSWPAYQSGEESEIIDLPSWVKD